MKITSILANFEQFSTFYGGIRKRPKTMGRTSGGPPENGAGGSSPRGATVRARTREMPPHRRNAAGPAPRNRSRPPQRYAPADAAQSTIPLE
ncbi:Hypothetical protein NTJ_15008 [Nesidiocoris tenuis]|uniref:Uncharacterized protein n=1 Tax=Nesidiocoris tenuis TaxID=355587 RepID=A0ABN7BCT5_9HEMI|nr:Hypothetical protein NTJ_15008 [Nesidiocoris tenuis]